MKKLILFLIICMAALSAARGNFSDRIINGRVFGVNFEETRTDTTVLATVHIYWAGTQTGTITDKDGAFSLSSVQSTDQLVIRHIGYQSDTLTVNKDVLYLSVYLETIQTLQQVTVNAQRPQTIRHFERTVNTESITQEGLRTLACCNLAESFENTVTVDVELTDAVSGARRIKMLGLAGFYTQILVEKNPMMRGLVSPFSLEYIPGFWIDEIDISKGTASVAAGYESITGQINVELKKPDKGTPAALNAYINNLGRSELSFIGSGKLSERVSTMLLSYGIHNSRAFDHNHDTFMDMPLVTHLSLMNRWKYSGDNSEVQFGAKIVHDKRDGGQMGFDFTNRPASELYGSRSQVKRYEFFAKAGAFLKGGASIGLILSGFQHDQESFWGFKDYTGKESGLYVSFIYEKSTGRHHYSAGLSLQFDDRSENYQDLIFETIERVPGIFAEYTFKPDKRLSVMAGFRYDHHSAFGSFYTPRMHLRYEFNESTSYRLSAGKGYRVPNVFMDNPAILASSRELAFMEELQAEKAWNFGIHWQHLFSLSQDRCGILTMDFYHTRFQNQVIADMETEVSAIHLYNLDGKSYSNSAQIELIATAAKGLDVTAAYRFNDVKTTYSGQLQELLMNSMHKGLLVFSYTLPGSLWRLDITTQFNGRARLPDTQINPPQYRLDAFSPNYTQMFVQLTRQFQSLEVYAGVENLTGFRQKYPILAWQEPFSPFFDSSLIWGPTHGRKIYIGFRLN